MPLRTRGLVLTTTALPTLEKTAIWGPAAPALCSMLLPRRCSLRSQKTPRTSQRISASLFSGEARSKFYAGIFKAEIIIFTNSSE